ncbi:hypothetical protein EDB92DRAFT_1863608 [Lactarius akahatsu]|uniref:Secreted protein n=1 Tax=Lactarius akahatsu TaxID=416441 RepID=A0AAD4LGM3_9AGAM|nr:hypothetical protein EDB92DRAFT_1863608 [Lactarius akahatsu]
MCSKSFARASLLAATSLAALRPPMRTPMPAKITFAGENTYISEASRLTRPTPSETAAENAYRTFTVGINHFVNLLSPLRAWSNSRTWS